jgi:predicted dehydrogenase
MSEQSNRRDFLKQTALAGIGFWAAGGLTEAANRKSPNEQLNIACIGVGGKGSSDTDQAGNCGHVIALCDIDDKFLDEKAKKFTKARKYNDYRKMLEEMEKDIDAVVVSTPDHTHAPASLMAMRMKKHVYCQKPLTHTVYEARLMRDTARKMGVVTQMGNQGSAENGLRRAVEQIQAGIIGPVTEVHVWTNRPIWPQAPKVTARPKDTPKPPAHVHWDLWLGTAPERPYAVYPKNDKGEHPAAYHPFAWRGWWDFGTGALGDMACHTANLPFRALKLGLPRTISAESDKINPETYPGWARIAFEFDGPDGSPVKLTWYEGHKGDKVVVPSPDLLRDMKVVNQGYSVQYKDGKIQFSEPKPVDSGCMLIGSKGILFSPSDYGADAYVLRGSEIERITGDPEKLAKNGKGDEGMKAEWVAAIKADKPEMAYSNFDFAATLTEAILLGNVAMRVGKKLEWDAEQLRARNCPEADQYIKIEPRKGWSL